MPSMQVWTLQYLIDLQARERERKERVSEIGGRGRGERGRYHKLPSSKNSRLTPAGWQLSPFSVVLATGYIGSLQVIAIVAVNL